MKPWQFTALQSACWFGFAAYFLTEHMRGGRCMYDTSWFENGIVTLLGAAVLAGGCALQWVIEMQQEIIEEYKRRLAGGGK
jgi:hypothetical protein